jgi:hypothetical protein
MRQWDAIFETLEARRNGLSPAQKAVQTRRRNKGLLP